MAKSKCSIDTNVLIDWLVSRDESRHRKALDCVRSHTEVQIADVVISELVYVFELIFKMERSLVADNLTYIISRDNVNCNRTLIRNALPLYVKNPKLSWIDCCAVIYAELNDALPLYTFDKKLVLQGGGRAKSLA